MGSNKQETGNSQGEDRLAEGKPTPVAEGLGLCLGKGENPYHTARFSGAFLTSIYLK